MREETGTVKGLTVFGLGFRDSLSKIICSVDGSLSDLISQVGLNFSELSYLWSAHMQKVLGDASSWFRSIPY